MKTKTEAAKPTHTPDGLLDNRAGQAVRTERALRDLLEAASVGLAMIEEHGLDEMDGKTTHAARLLRAAILRAQEGK